jgi:cytochrome c556
MRKPAVIAALLAMLGMAAALGVAAADDHADRQALMRANNAAVTAMDGIIIGVLRPEAIKAQAQILIDNGGKIPALFAPATDHNDPAILPALWTDQAGFKAAADKMVADARVLLQPSTDRLALVKALAVVQADCAACHKAYRVAAPDGGRGRGGRRGGAAAQAAPPPPPADANAAAAQ